MFSRNFFSTLNLYSNMGAEASPGTPRELANEMLDRLPQNIWSDPTKTFLEPCFSNGMFYFLMIERLFGGLASVIPDPKARIGHILTKQVWAYEMNKVPHSFVKKMLEKQLGIGTVIKIKPNIYFKNIISKEIDMKFDVVVMNPPYQAPQNATGKRGGGGQLWPKFAKNSIQTWTKDDGYICAVHPALWRKPNTGRAICNGMFDLMTAQNHMQYLEIHDSKDGVKTFNANTRYDWYVIAKNKSGLTTIKDQSGKVSEMDLKEHKWLPNHSFTEVFSLLGDGAGVIYDRSAYGNDKKHTSREKRDGFPYPLIHSTTKSGINYFYSSTNQNGHFGVRKAIFGTSGIHDVVIDIDGAYGMTDNSIAIPIENYEDGSRLKDFLMSERFKNISNACSWSGYRVEWRLFTYFKEGFWRE
jgi:hypothetical protein